MSTAKTNVNAPRMSDVTTHGIRVGAMAFFLPGESKPDEGEYVFGYRILIVNESQSTVELLSRHWKIIDGDGQLREVRGRGVVGEMPVLKPGEGFKYTSFARLPTNWGTMEGKYVMKRDDAKEIEVDVGRFWLVQEFKDDAS